MRNKLVNSGLTVNAIAGTNVVLLGFDLAPAQRQGCLGFAIQREDHTEDERYWLKGMKTFRETDPGLGPGEEVSSHKHPFQGFQWADYSAKPDHDYTYKVVSLYGTPKDLQDGSSVSIPIRTESEYGAGLHSVFFNRGAIASQEYARRFQNKAPDQLQGDAQAAAYRWLSRGLFEALAAFVGRAQGPSFGLYGAVYEFQRSEALKAIKAAADTGARVSIIYDAIPGGPVQKNEQAIAQFMGDGLCIPRKIGKLMHNKFFVLTKDDQPIAVWTGSTNLTENGIYGHSNLGHIVEDAAVAQAYMNYWTELRDCADTSSEKAWMAQNNANPPSPWADDLRMVFSPRKGLKVLKWYADIAGGTHKPLFMTFAFGMHKSFQSVYEQPDGVLRFALMEKEGSGTGLEQGKVDIARIRRLPNVLVAVGNSIVTNSFDRWLQEKRQLTAEANIRFIHTKYMLVDPLGDCPIVVTGSANFSEPSTDTNNENMLLIRGDRRVADIYLGEFMRLYSHYAYRESVARARKNGLTLEQWQPAYLATDDSWQADYFRAGHQRCLRREYFAGPQIPL